jgi:methionine sulfoxide reductase heme-binding subunit
MGISQSPAIKTQLSQNMRASKKTAWLHPATKPALFVLCCLPFFWLTYSAFTDALGPNPAEALIRATGDWTLRALCLVLLVTPGRVISHTPALARFRRMLGLFVFFYAAIHMLSYSIFDMGLDVAEIVTDIIDRPFILVGFLALLLLMALSATSFNRAIRWLGSRRWQTLHKSVYLVALLSLLHFFWMRAGKNNFLEVGVYAAIIFTLLGWRVWYARFKKERL